MRQLFWQYQKNLLKEKIKLKVFYFQVLKDNDIIHFTYIKLGLRFFHLLKNYEENGKRKNYKEHDKEIIEKEKVTHK